MSENLRAANGYPPEVLGFSLNPAIQAADTAHDIAHGFNRYVPGGWKVRDGVRGLVRAQVMLGQAAPYVEAMSSYQNPGEQLGADLEEVRSAVETDLLARNPGMGVEDAARSVTPGQVAQSVGFVLGNRLFAPETNPDALRTPLLRDLASVYARQKIGPTATPADILKHQLPSDMILKAAAPEILLALGFDPTHPMVASADRGGFVRGAGKLFAGGKLAAITKAPKLARHVQAMLPPNGEDLRRNFAMLHDFLGSLTTPAQVQR